MGGSQREFSHAGRSEGTVGARCFHVEDIEVIRDILDIRDAAGKQKAERYAF
jgi:hypothetical protein